ncbi:MAG: helix-turn-helix transcriptional regulator, partial [Pseudomonadota bacterium]
MTFDQLIGQRLLALRQANHLSMADLALLSGVSKAMISKIEGGDCSASANILGRLAAALGVPLTQLLAKEDAPTQRLKTRASQELWSDPEAGYLRRQVVTRDAHS